MFSQVYIKTGKLGYVNFKIINNDSNEKEHITGKTIFNSQYFTTNQVTMKRENLLATKFASKLAIEFLEIARG